MYSHCLNIWIHNCQTKKFVFDSVFQLKPGFLIFGLVIVNQCDHISAGQIISDEGRGRRRSENRLFWSVFKDELIHAIVTSTVCLTLHVLG